MWEWFDTKMRDIKAFLEFLWTIGSQNYIDKWINFSLHIIENIRGKEGPWHRGSTMTPGGVWVTYAEHASGFQHKRILVLCPVWRDPLDNSGI